VPSSPAAADAWTDTYSAIGSPDLARADASPELHIVRAFEPRAPTRLGVLSVVEPATGIGNIRITFRLRGHRLFEVIR
jgi:hypothetical protein